MTTAKATLQDGRVVDFETSPIGEGREKTAYFTPDRRFVVLLYKDHRRARDPNHQARLEAILGKWNPTVPRSEGGAAENQAVADFFRRLFCWPEGIVVRPQIGVLAPTYSSDFFFATGNWKGQEKKGRWFSSPKLRQYLPPSERGNWLNYLQLCIQMARAVRKMHFIGLAHSDLSDNNVLVDPTGGKSVVCDIDSLVVPGLFPPDVLGTRGYIAPEVMATQKLPLDDPNRKLPSNRTDEHAMAVLIYEYLLRRHPIDGPKVNSAVSTDDDYIVSMGQKALFVENPHDTSNRLPGINVTYQDFGPYLEQLFYKAFVLGLHEPERRPGVAEWEQGLYRTTDLLIPCGNSACEEKWFVYRQQQKPRCPWCGWTLTTPMPVFDFYYAPRHGEFRPEGHCLVAWNQRPLRKWHVYTNLLPVEGVERDTQAYVVFHRGEWLLVNVALESLTTPSGNPVPKGQAVRLRDGYRIYLTKEDHGRCIQIKFIT